MSTLTGSSLNEHIVRKPMSLIYGRMTQVTLTALTTNHHFLGSAARPALKSVTQICDAWQINVTSCTTTGTCVGVMSLQNEDQAIQTIDLEAVVSTTLTRIAVVLGTARVDETIGTVAGDDQWLRLQLAATGTASVASVSDWFVMMLRVSEPEITV